MKLDSIASSVPNILDPRDLKPQQAKAKEVKNESNFKKDSANITNWQKDILLSAINDLENNIQPDNSHPLTRSDYRPIDSYQEALVELKFLNNSTFKSEAGSAQANLSGQDVVSLFTE